MAGNFDDTRENEGRPEDPDEFDLDAELAGLSSFLQEMGVQLEDEVTGDEVTGGVSFDFAGTEGGSPKDVSRLFSAGGSETGAGQGTDGAEEAGYAEEEEDLSWIFGTDEDFFDHRDRANDSFERAETDEIQERLKETGDFPGSEEPAEPEDGINWGSEAAEEPAERKEDAVWQWKAAEEPAEQEENTAWERETAEEPAEQEENVGWEPEFPEETEEPEEKDATPSEDPEEQKRIEKEVDKVLRKTFGSPFSWKREVLSWVAMFAIAFALAFVIDNYLIVNATVPTGSMQNTIMAGDRMIGWRLSYLFSDPERGDIIIFEYPDDPEEIYVKRVIGLPGETVTITNGEIYINDSTEPLEEDYLPEEWVWKNNGYTFVVPADSYLCLGDNRNNSHDARSWTNTYVTKDAILGQAILCYWPTDDIGWLN